jgi:uncharacterized protein
VTDHAAAHALSVTPVVAALCAALHCVLTGLVVQRRRQTGIDFLDGGDRVLQRRIRAHGNLSETVPIALVLLALLELQGGGTPVLATLGALLLSGRIVHAWALVRADSKRARIVGMVLTVASISIAATMNLWGVLARG